MPISREALDEHLRLELINANAADLSWWNAHRVEPYLVNRHGHSHYAVAHTDGPPLVFFEQFQTFGQHASEPCQDGLRLYHNLADAIRRLAAQELLSHVLSNTASKIQELGFLDRKDDDDGTLMRALQVLFSLGPDASIAVPKLIEIATNDDILGGVTEQAVGTLAAIGSAAAPAVPRLIEMAEKDIASARGACLAAFGTIGPAAAAAVPLLIDILFERVAIDPDPFYAAMAANALGNIQSIDALPPLLQVLEQTHDPDIACAVSEAIGKFGSAAAKAVTVLARLAEGHTDATQLAEDPDVQRIAREALHRVTHGL